MASPNPYDNCPCGSGKKFKWCCAAYWDKIEQGLDLHQKGQVESALRVLAGACQEMPAQPQVWGFYAHVLFREGQIDKAEEAVARAFEADPNFAMGHLLRGLFRQSEGEVIGALLLYRKAADAYAPDAQEQLAQVYEMIARNELVLGRPVASRAALERAVRYSPGDQEAREQYDALYGDDSRMPEAARHRYSFRPTAKPVTVPPQARFSDARAAYERLAAEVPTDPAAWFNLGLARAWLGDQGPALEALNKSVELEYDDARAEEAAALAEVLKVGQGMEAESDYVEYRAYMQIRDANAVLQLLRAWEQEGRMIGAQSDESGQSFGCMVCNELPSLFDTGPSTAKVTANLHIANGVMRVWHASKESVADVVREIRDRLQLAVGEPIDGTGPAQFADIVQEALAYPTRVANVDEAEKKMKEYAERFFDNDWVNRPLKALHGVRPLDAGGSKLMRKKLLGVLKFVQDCVIGAVPRRARGEVAVPMNVYDFDRLRHKLGAEKQTSDGPPADLLAAASGATGPATTAPAAPSPAKKDFAAMSAADLGLLKADDLTAVETEEAMKASLKLDARELAVAFAKAGIGKPADAAKTDRYALYLCAIQGAIAENDQPAALTLAEGGAAYDAEHNGGKRANEFGLRKAQLLAKTGNTDGAAAEFEALIARNPDEPRFIVTAAEAMLSARQGAKALAFAERGLEKARESGNRDLEGACLELSEAAKRAK